MQIFSILQMLEFDENCTQFLCTSWPLIFWEKSCYKHKNIPHWYYSTICIKKYPLPIIVVKYALYYMKYISQAFSGKMQICVLLVADPEWEVQCTKSVRSAGLYLSIACRTQWVHSTWILYFLLHFLKVYCTLHNWHGRFGNNTSLKWVNFPKNIFYLVLWKWL